MAWPSMNVTDWLDTCETIHMWTQIIGKVRLKREAPVNHWWHVALYVTPSGLTTSAFPVGERMLELAFDFQKHTLNAIMSDGTRGSLALKSQPIAEFYARAMDWLEGLDARTAIVRKPNEVDPAIPFDRDMVHGAYEPPQAERFLQTLVQADRVLKRFRTSFIGKASPVHFFWGSFDLAVTRFSGRTAPLHPGGIPNLPDSVAREAYSHEVSSAGFWPGNRQFPEALFYSYAYPEPDRFKDAAVQPVSGRYDKTLREFVLPYEAVRSSSDPDRHVLDFLESTYSAAADLGAWNRQALERPAFTW